MEQSMLGIMAVHIGWVAAELKRQRDQVAPAYRCGKHLRELYEHPRL